jgi:hypothetical protein
MGFGTSPLGGFPVGFSAADTVAAPAVPTAFVRDIDQATRDYSIDAKTGAFKRTTPVRQRVQLALSTTFGSSTVLRTWGVRRPRKMGGSFAAEVEQSVRDALRDLVTEGLVVVESVTVEKGSGGRSRATVVFRDLTAGATYTEGVIVG